MEAAPDIKEKGQGKPLKARQTSRQKAVSPIHGVSPFAGTYDPGLCPLGSHRMCSLYEAGEVGQDGPLPPSKPLVVCVHLKVLLALDHPQVGHQRGERVVRHLRGGPA